MRTSIRARRSVHSARQPRHRHAQDAPTALSPGDLRFAIGSADAGTRERLLTTAQRSVGNAALGRVLATIVPGASGSAAGGVSLHGETTADFDGGRSSWSPRSIRRAADCTDCPADDPCIHATGTFTIRYHADVTIRMPDMPGGLTACQQRRVRAFLKDVLGPHERDHARRFHTYDGVVPHAIDFTGCGRTALQAHLQDIHDAEEAKRQADANARSAAIDPFVREVDLDCN
jgi:hypothetical protein